MQAPREPTSLAGTHKAGAHLAPRSNVSYQYTRSTPFQRTCWETHARVPRELPRFKELKHTPPTLPWPCGKGRGPHWGGGRAHQQHECLPRLLRKDTGSSKPDSGQALSQSLTGPRPHPTPQAQTEAPPRPLRDTTSSSSPRGTLEQLGAAGSLPLLKRHPFLRQLRLWPARAHPPGHAHLGLRKRQRPRGPRQARGPRAQMSRMAQSHSGPRSSEPAGHRPPSLGERGPFLPHTLCPQ